jgi:hypothetical protein
VGRVPAAAAIVAAGEPLLVETPEEREDQDDHDQREHGPAVEHGTPSFRWFD